MVKFLESDPEIRIDPMATIFPRVTKCSYYKYGPSGTVQTHDAICVLVRSEVACIIINSRNLHVGSQPSYSI